MSEISDAFLAKARESLAGAESEQINQRFNNVANRAYYACFQAAIAALDAANVHPSGGKSEWSHEFVQAEFSRLINRRKLYPAALRDTLSQIMLMRLRADYEIAVVIPNHGDCSRFSGREGHQ